MLTVNGRNGLNDNTDLEVLRTTDNFSKPFFLSSNAKYLVKGSMILQDNNGYLKNQSNGTAHYGYFPTTELESGFQGNFWGGSELEITKNCLRLRMQIKLGEKYYTGST